MTNCIESVLILLACGSIRATFSSTAPDMSANGIVDRYRPIQPKIMFAESKVLYASKNLDFGKKLDEAVRRPEADVPQLERVVVSGPLWDHPKV